MVAEREPGARRRPLLGSLAQQLLLLLQLSQLAHSPCEGRAEDGGAGRLESSLQELRGALGLPDLVEEGGRLGHCERIGRELFETLFVLCLAALGLPLLEREEPVGDAQPRPHRLGHLSLRGLQSLLRRREGLFGLIDAIEPDQRQHPGYGHADALRVELEHPVDVAERLLEPIRPQVGLGAQLQHREVVRLDRQHPVGGCDGVVGGSPPNHGLNQQGAGIDGVIGRLRGPTQRPQRETRLSAAQQRRAQEVVDLGLIGILVHERPQALDGFREPPAPMELANFDQRVFGLGRASHARGGHAADEKQDADPPERRHQKRGWSDFAGGM
jgi:hypothetical protein